MLTLSEHRQERIRAMGVETTDLDNDGEVAVANLEALVEQLEMQEYTCEINSGPSLSSAGLGALQKVLPQKDRILKLATQLLPGRQAEVALPEIVARAEALEAEVKRIFTSEAGRRAVRAQIQLEMQYRRSGSVFPAELGEPNALLVSVGHFGENARMVLFAYGQEITREVALVTAPREVLEYVHVRVPSAVIPLGVDPETVKTMAGLWEPDGDGPLSKGDTLREAAERLAPRPARSTRGGAGC